MICDLYSPALLHGIVIEVDIAAFVEAVVRGPVRWRGEVVVDVCKSADTSAS